MSDKFWEATLGVSIGTAECPQCRSKVTFSGTPTVVNLGIKEFVELHRTCSKTVVPCRCGATRSHPATAKCGPTTFEEYRTQERTFKPRKPLLCPCGKIALPTGIFCTECRDKELDNVLSELNKLGRESKKTPPDFGSIETPRGKSASKAEQKPKAKKCTRSEGHDGPCNGYPCPARETELIDRMLGRKSAKPLGLGETPRKKYRGMSPDFENWKKRIKKFFRLPPDWIHP